jgi:hypothetical protein
MTFTQIGLVLNIVGVLVLAFESWIKLRTIRADSIVIGHGQIGLFWRLLFLTGYPLLLLGFAFQFVGAS